MDIFHSRFPAFVMTGVFVVGVMVVWGGIARPWSYKHVNDDGVRGGVARGILVTTG